MTKKLKADIMIALSLVLAGVAGIGACVGIGASKAYKSMRVKNEILGEYNYDLKNLEYKNSYLEELEEKHANHELSTEEYNKKIKEIPDLNENEFVMNNEEIPEETKIRYQHEVNDNFKEGTAWLCSTAVFTVPLWGAYAYVDRLPNRHAKNIQHESSKKEKEETSATK